MPVSLYESKSGRIIHQKICHFHGLIQVPLAGSYHCFRDAFELNFCGTYEELQSSADFMNTCFANAKLIVLVVMAFFFCYCLLNV